MHAVLLLTLPQCTVEGNPKVRLPIVYSVLLVYRETVGMNPTTGWRVFSRATTFTVMAVFTAGMFIIGAARRRSSTPDIFLVADRSVGVFTGALSVASTWIWAPALFVAAQKAYQQGLPGMMWFTVPNVGCLVFFAFLARRITRIFPGGYTLPQYVALRFDARTHLVYLLAFVVLQVCSLGVQLIAGAALLDAMCGVPYAAGVGLLAALFASYSMIDGLRTSIRTDLLQMWIMLFGLGILIPSAVAAAGGWPAVAGGLAGFEGRHGRLLDLQVAYSFGITVSIGLLSGPAGDQQHWQRAFAFRPGGAFGGYLIGALIFAAVPVSMSLLGFAAAGDPLLASAVADGSLPVQQVGPELIRTVLPPWGLLLFMIVILAGLASTGDSALCAGASLITVDVYRNYLNPAADSARILGAARIAVAGMALSAVGIALIPGITILSLFLFYGTLRSSTLMPTLLMLFCRRVGARGMFWGASLAMMFGLPTYLAGEISGCIHLKVAANIGILIISFVLPFWDRKGTAP